MGELVIAPQVGQAEEHLVLGMPPQAYSTASLQVRNSGNATENPGFGSAYITYKYIADPDPGTVPALFLFFISWIRSFPAYQDPDPGGLLQFASGSETMLNIHQINQSKKRIFNPTFVENLAR